MTDETPFAVETFVIDDDTTIVIKSYHAGEVPAYRQRNGSGSYNARKYTEWVARVEVPGRVREFTGHSAYGGTKWETYEAARQAAKPNLPSGARQRYHHVVKAEMAAAKRRAGLRSHTPKGA